MENEAVRPVVLLTDFGLEDCFVGVVKGVILNVHPEAVIIDLCHAVEPQNVLQGSFLLSSSYEYFPSKSIFCAVVDPGVGSDRPAVCIETARFYFVGPDNGLLWKAAYSDGIKKIVTLDNKEYFLESVSSTFHGRDIFGPVAGALSKGIDDISCLGSQTGQLCRMEWPEPAVLEDRLEAAVLYVDRFGNLALNLDARAFHSFLAGRDFRMTVGGRPVTDIFQSYAQADEDHPFLIESSSGLMEISVKNGDAAAVLKAGAGDQVLLEKA